MDLNVNSEYYIAEEAQTPETYNCSTTPKGNPKRISINLNWERQKQIIKNKLSSTEGADIFWQRKIEPKTVIVHLRFNRVSIRGLRQVANELEITLMAGNLEKLSKGMANFSTLLSLHKKIDQIFEFIKRIFDRFFINWELCP